MRGRRAALVMAAVAAVGFTTKSVLADIIVNDFDNADSAAEIAQWRLDFGNFQTATLGFSSDDADGSATSGSMDVLLNYNTATGAQFVDYTRDFFPGMDGTQFLTLNMDVKVVGGSATDQFGQSGYFQLSTRNGDSYTSAGDFADNVRASDGWRHISVPLNPPDDSIRGLTFQLYSAEATNSFPGPSGVIDLHIDNVKFVTTPPPPGALRAGHQFSFESASEIDSTHNGGQTTKSFAFGDSYDGNAVDHTQSTLYPTDGTHTLRLSQPLNSYHVGTVVQYNQSDTTRYNGLVHGTKMLLDVTTPPHGPSYQTLEADLDFAYDNANMGATHEYLSSYGTNGYQFVDGNPGGDQTRTVPLTQTFTWDYGGLMMEQEGQYFRNITNYVNVNFATGNGGAAAGDASPDATAEYFLDNMRLVNEDVTTRAAWQTTSTADWNSANWGTVNLAFGNDSVTPASAPNGVGAPAIFYGYGAGTGAGSVNSTVTVSSAITVGSIVFDSQMTSFDGESAGISADSLPKIVNYTLSGSGSLTIDSGANASEIYAIAGNHTIAVPVQVNSNLEIDTSAGFTADTGGLGRPANVAMTSLTFTQPISLANKTTLTTHGAGTVNFAAVSGGSAGFAINGGHANLNGNISVASLGFSGGSAKVTAGGSTVLRAGLLYMGGTLDLTNNKMILDYSGTSQIGDVKNALASGYDGGAWNGIGIVSSTAAASTGVKTAIGYGDAATLHISNFGGQGVTSAVLLEYTLMGDANLDGKVNLLDLNAIATNFGGSSKVWTDGDTTYDGNVNIQDFNALALNFGQTLPSSALPLGALVPEPSSCALLAAIGIASSRLRRRKAR
jgi:hypothetical protein